MVTCVGCKEAMGFSIEDREGKAETLAYIFFFVYVFLMIAVAIISFFKNKKAVKAQGGGSVAAEDTTHFLGQRDLGYVVIYFNIMASFTSGTRTCGLPPILAFGSRLACKVKLG